MAAAHMWVKAGRLGTHRRRVCAARRRSAGLQLSPFMLQGFVAKNPLFWAVGGPKKGCGCLQHRLGMQGRGRGHLDRACAARRRRSAVHLCEELLRRTAPAAKNCFPLPTSLKKNYFYVCVLPKQCIFEENLDGPGLCEELLRRTRAKNPSLRPLPPLLTELACTQPSQVRAPPPGPPSSPSPCAGARLTAHGPVGRCEEPPPPLCNAGSRVARRH